jgi:soluble lytic murein transglycosylase-like protein
MRRFVLGALIAGTIHLGIVPLAGPGLAQAAAKSSLDRWQSFIAEASRRFGVSEAWIRAVMRAESGGRTVLGGRPITSAAGAMGLMQIMPETWAELRARYGFGADPYDPRDNILAGTAYLRELYIRYGYPNLFAAYNAGPARFDAHLFQGLPLPDETVNYLAALGQPMVEAPRTPVMVSGTRLFFSRLAVVGAASRPAPASAPGGLFVPLGTGPEGAP